MLTEFIAKIKQGYHFLDHLVYLSNILRRFFSMQHMDQTKLAVY